MPNIKKIESIDKSIKQILDIKDSNVSFPKDTMSKQEVLGRMCNNLPSKLWVWFCDSLFFKKLDSTASLSIFKGL
ncbi:hypothetical protein BH742_12255 [Enterococcus durans]|nr:hypothetical protein BH742_12255 [Enterococcus durans]